MQTSRTKFFVGCSWLWHCCEPCHNPEDQSPNLILMTDQRFSISATLKCCGLMWVEFSRLFSLVSRSDRTSAWMGDVFTNCISVSLNCRTVFWTSWRAKQTFRLSEVMSWGAEELEMQRSCSQDLKVKIIRFYLYIDVSDGGVCKRSRVLYLAGFQYSKLITKYLFE
jgi:hypothetical protein